MSLLNTLLAWALSIKNQTQPLGNTETLVGGLFEQIIQYFFAIESRISSIILGIIWKTPVPTFSALATTFPTPTIGWASLVEDEGLIYSYNGTQWVSTGLTAFPDNVATLDDVAKKVDKEVIYNISQATGITYTDKQTARNAVPANLRSLGQIITYKLTTGWFTEQFVGDNVSGWGVDGNWKVVGKVTENIVTYTVGNELNNLDISSFGTQINKTLAFATGRIAGVIGSPASSTILWRVPLIIGNTYTISIPDNTQVGVSEYRVFIHNTTADANAVEFIDLSINGALLSGVYTPKDSGLYLTCYLKLVYPLESINYDVTSTLTISHFSESTIEAAGTFLSINKLANAAYGEEPKESIYTPLSLLSAERRGGALESTGNWVSSAISSSIVWRFKLKRKTKYKIALSAGNFNAGLRLFFHKTTANGVASVVLTPVGNSYEFTTDMENIYITFYMSIVYPGITFDMSSTLSMYEGGESSLNVLGISLPLSSIINNDSKIAESLVHNVRDYGAKGDGVTDDTDAIQECLDHVVDVGGGTVYIPNGVYRLSKILTRDNVSAHLIIKPRGVFGQNHQWVQVRIIGESCVDTASNYSNHTNNDSSVVPWQTGTILKSDYDGVIQTTASNIPLSVLACGNSGESISWGFSTNNIYLENIAVQVKVESGKYPILSGVNMRNAISLRARNVLVYGSVSNLLQTAPSADGHYSAGFICPKLWCNPECHIQDIYVKAGFRYGFIISEHMKAKNISVWDCENGIAFSKMDHAAQIGFAHCQNVKNIITALPVNTMGHTEGTSFVDMQMVGIESNSGQIPTDFNYAAFIEDPGNRIKGRLTYHIVRSNIGADNSVFVKNGGANITTSTLF